VEEKEAFDEEDFEDDDDDDEETIFASCFSDLLNSIFNCVPSKSE